MPTTKKREWRNTTAYTRMISVRLPIELTDQLQRFCEQHGTTVTEVVFSSLIEYLDRKENGEA